MGVIPCPPNHIEQCKDRFLLSADLGQSADPTAISVIHHRHFQHINVQGHVRDAGDLFDVRYLRRLPLGMSYVEQVAEIGTLLARPPLNLGCDFCIDETGVGRAVGDLFDNQGMKPTRITITGGHAATVQGRRRYHVPKGLLISMLDARLHNGDLRFAASLTDAGAMADELKDFRRKVSVAGRYSYEARVGAHDDLVLSVAIGLWVALKPKPPTAAIGTYSYVSGVSYAGSES